MVSVIWSTTNGGTAISSNVDLGSKANGEVSTDQTIHLRHDGANVITGVGLYIREFSGAYSGSVSAASDYAELLAWGDATAEDDFGGIFINMDAINSFTSTEWPAYDDKTTTYGFVCRTGVGDTEGNAVTVSKNTTSASGTDGQVPVGSSPNVRFQVRARVPTNEDTIGTRLFDLTAVYSATS